MTGTEPHAPLGTAGRGPNWDRGRARRGQPGWAVHRPRELRVDSCTSRHSRPRDPLGTAGRKRAEGAARLGADQRVYACVGSAPPAAGPARGAWAASGPEELLDSELSHGCRRDTVTVCFQYLVPQVTVSDD
jgi:hypothetical protein